MIFERLNRLHCHPRESKAIELLQHPETYPGLAPWQEHDTRVTFVCLPSFQPYSVWTLQRRENCCQVRRIEWDRIADYEAAKIHPEGAPTTFGSDGRLPVESVEELLDEMASISLPTFIPVAALGLDGVSFAIIFGSAWCSSGFSWWCKPPEAWQPLERCYQNAIALSNVTCP